MYVGDYERMSGETIAAPVATVLGPAAKDRDDEPGDLVVRWDQLADLLRMRTDVWSTADIPPSLIEHAIVDAERSNLVLGDTPETWSPLGLVDRADFGGLVEDQETWMKLSNGRTLVRAIDRSAALVFIVDGEDAATLAFAPDAFVLPVPADVSAVAVTYRPRDDADLSRLEDWAGLFDWQASELIVWRVYSGQNTWIRDVVTSTRSGVHHLSLRALEGGGFVVGRALRTVARRIAASKGDPLWKSRRARAEEKRRVTADACPALDRGCGEVDGAVVVVHGTMSTGLLLASVSKELAPGVAVRRFEHDTWLRLDDNARQLAAYIQATVKTAVALVAHSRGGLVAASAADIIKRAGTPKVSAIITLGTPFEGTPLATAGNFGVMGSRGLMGGLRWAGGPVVDAATRLAALAIRSDPPPGIELMVPGNDTLSLLLRLLPDEITLFAGDAGGGTLDHFGLATAKSGVGRGAFGTDANDLVVSERSALAARTGITLGCDHYSYPDQPMVHAAIRAAAYALPPTPDSKLSR